MIRVFLLLLLCIHCMALQKFCNELWNDMEDKCYKVIHYKTRWDATETVCNKLNSSLAALETEKENIAFVNMAVYSLFPYIWLNGKHDPVTGKWFWMPGRKPFTYTNWDVGQPKITTPDYNCIVMHLEDNNEYKWETHRCGSYHHYICERENWY